LQPLYCIQNEIYEELYEQDECELELCRLHEEMNRLRDDLKVCKAKQQLLTKTICSDHVKKQQIFNKLDPKLKNVLASMIDDKSMQS